MLMEKISSLIFTSILIQVLLSTLSLLRCNEIAILSTRWLFSILILLHPLFVLFIYTKCVPFLLLVQHFLHHQIASPGNMHHDKTYTKHGVYTQNPSTFPFDEQT